MDLEELDKSWRSLAAQGKDLEAARLLEKYIIENRSINPTLYFHAAQEYACSGPKYYLKAIEFLKSAKKPNNDSWNSYVNATIGFLKSDKSILEAEIQKQKNKELFDVSNKLKVGLESNLNYKEAYDG